MVRVVEVHRGDVVLAIHLTSTAHRPAAAKAHRACVCVLGNTVVDVLDLDQELTKSGAPCCHSASRAWERLREREDSVWDDAAALVC